jgi:hypothetical protein
MMPGSKVSFLFASDFCKLFGLDNQRPNHETWEAMTLEEQQGFVESLLAPAPLTVEEVLMDPLAQVVINDKGEVVLPADPLPEPFTAEELAKSYAEIPAADLPPVSLPVDSPAESADLGRATDNSSVSDAGDSSGNGSSDSAPPSEPA